MTQRRPPHHKLNEPRAWFAIFWNKKGWIAIIAAVVLVVATLIAGDAYRKAAEFERSGTWTVGSVISKRIDTGDDSDTYHITLSFKPNARAEQRVEHRVSRAEYFEIKVGSNKRLRYLPSNPRVTELNEGDTQQSGWAAQMVALAAGLIGLGALWMIGTDTNRAVKARRHGELQIATVARFVEHDNSGTPSGRGYMVWKLENGKRGESLSQPIGPLRRIGVGGKINVYVRGDDSVWERDVGPRPQRISKLPNVKR
ncbi:MAG: DUF3592 domain-containing protein [Pseudomonadota bacterium]